MLIWGKKLIIILFWGVLLLGGRCYATETLPEIMLRKKKLTIREIFRTIEQQTSYRFSYVGGIVDVEKPVFIDCKKCPLDRLLEETIAGDSLQYRIIKEDIIISRSYFLEQASLSEEKFTVSGKVTDNENRPLAGATVLVVDRGFGMSTRGGGEFSLPVSVPAVLQISFVGYKTRLIPVSKSGSLQIILDEDVQELGPVVVTALEMNKERKSVGFSVQELKGRDMVKSREFNVLSSLTGRITGLSVANSPDLFVAPKIELRGKQPLIVVDGVPVEEDAWNINADDIESFVVLKGPTAAALFGSRGQNGVIQVVTKRGSSLRRKFSVEINSNTQVQIGFNQIPEVQHEYGPGERGKYAFGDGPFGDGGVNYTNFNIWGPRFEGQLIPQWDSPLDPTTGKRVATPWVAKGKDNLQHFLRTGMLTNNHVSLGITNEDSDIRFSFSNSYQRGLVPNTDLRTNHFSCTAGGNLAGRLRIDGAVNYSSHHSKNYPVMEYGPENFIYAIQVFNGSHYDIRDLKNYWYPGKEGKQQKNVEYYYFNNPWFVAHELLRGYKKNNVYGFVKAKVEVASGLDIYLRNYTNFSYRTENMQEPPSLKNGRFEPYGYYEESNEYKMENDIQALATFSRSFGKWEVNATLGGNYRYNESRSLQANTNGGLIVPDIYSLSNSHERISEKTFNTYKQVLSGHFSVDINYRFLYLALTGRSDKSSALPVTKNSYFYPSVALSLVVSDGMALPEWCSFLKLRGAFARVGSDFPLYEWSNTYPLGEWWGDKRPMYSGNTWYDIDVMKPNFKTSFEGGVEAKFWNDRVGVELVYHHTIDGPTTFSQEISGTTGFTYRKVNGCTYLIRGWECSLYLLPLTGRDFKWDMAVNLFGSRQYLKALYGDIGSLGKIKIGERTDQYWRTVFEKSPDGQLVYEANGFPKQDPYKRKVCYLRPNVSGSFTTTVNYRKFTLALSVDGKMGGKVWSEIEYHLWRGGRHVNSVTPERYDEVVKGEMSYIGEGVVVASGQISYDGEGNVVSDTRQFVPNTTKVFYSDWVKRYYTNENLIVSKTFFKLRDVSLTYHIPGNLLFGGEAVQKISVSLVGRNLFYWGRNRFTDMDAYADSDNTLVFQTPSARSLGINFSVVF